MQAPARTPIIRGPGLAPRWIVGLAALTLPRVIGHDLDLTGPLVNAVLVVVPPAIWIVVVLRRTRDPFPALVCVGLVAGVMLAVTHQILWIEAFDGDPPRLGGNLADAPDWLHDVLTRGGAVASSLVTGALMGAVTGALALLVRRTRAGDEAPAPVSERR